MNLNEQRRFFLLEFYSWTERFLKYMSIATIVLLGVVLAQSFFSIGNDNSQLLAYTFGLLVLAMGIQLLVFWARIDRGFGISGYTVLFLPWLAFLFLDFSETPWRTEYALCENLLPVLAFFVTIHCARSERIRWTLISLTAVVALVFALSEFMQRSSESSGGGVEGTLSVIGHSFRSSFENTTGIGGVLLLVFFAMSFLVGSSHFKMWSRFFGVYMSALFLLGIALTRHVGVYLGFLAGCALAVQLLVRRKILRVALWGLLAGCVAISIGNSNINVGCLKTVPVSTEIQKNFTDKERLLGVRYVIPYAAIQMFKENPAFGVGAGRFSDEFEKYRPPQWQTEPETAGSFYLQVLAEHGLVGMVLLFGPLVFLFIGGVLVCQKLPWRKDTEHSVLRRKMGMLDLGGIPETRVVLAGTLCGLLAVAVLFAVDYPKNIPGVSIACAIFGGIAAFLLSKKNRRKIIFEGSLRHILLPVAFLVPALCSFLFLPLILAESEFRKGSVALKTFFLNATTGTSVDEKVDSRELLLAEAHFRAALRKNPEHGDAWNALSKKNIVNCQYDPINTGKYGALLERTTKRALECSTAVPEFYQMRAISEMIRGDFEGAKENIAQSDAMAPLNAPLLLLSAEILRAFPQGLPDASLRLKKISILLPESHYVEKMLALMQLGAETRGESIDKKPVVDEFIIPEF